MINRYLRALRGRSPAELRDRASQNISILLERAGLLVSPPAIRFTGSAQLTSCVHQDDFAGQFRESWPAEADAIITTADRILLGKYDLLGYSGIEWGATPDWQLDPVSGKRASMKHWSSVPYLNIHEVGDHKVTWELNRHQWMVTLAQAWRLTGNSEYASRAAALLNDWLRQNPPKRGINWASSLELGFRSIAWCWILHLLENAPAPDEALRERMLASLHLQGRHIERYLSTWFSPNTHLTGEALALLYLGTALPALPRAAHWHELGWQILLNEATRQIRDDGVYFEQTTWYQGYTVDFYLHAIRLRRSCGRDVPGWLTERVGRAAKVLASVALPDGTIPLLGDDDGGRLLPLRPQARADFRDTLALAALVLGEPQLMPEARDPVAALAWMVTPQELATVMGMEASDRPEDHNAFPAGGLYVIRDNRSQLVLDAGPHGALSGAHSHADALSLVLSVDGRPALIDPGTFTYLGAERDNFRGTAAHNTVEVDGRMSSEPDSGFRWNTFARSEVLRWFNNSGFALWEASHDGYSRLPDPVLHRRVVLWLRNEYGIVCDIVESAARGAHSAVGRWHGPAGAKLHLESVNSAILSDGKGPLLTLMSHLQLADGRRNVSTSYGQSASAPLVKAAWKVNGQAASVTVLVPGASPDGPVSCQGIEAHGGSAWVLRGNDRSDFWLLRSELQMEAAGVVTGADMVWLRRNDRGRAVEFIAAGTGTVRIDDIEVLTVRGCVHARNDENGNWTFEEI